MESWPKDREDALAYLWVVKRFTTYQCAAQLGCSRSAIAGKVHRLKLKRHNSNNLTVAQKNKRLKEMKRLCRAKWNLQMITKKRKGPKPPNLDFTPRKLKKLTPPSTAGVTILARKPTECAYPLDNGLFCGAPVICRIGKFENVEFTSWCEYHWALCHKKEVA